MTFASHFTEAVPTRPGWYWSLHANGEQVLPILVIGEAPNLFASGIVLVDNPMLRYTFMPLDDLVQMFRANRSLGWAGPFDGPFDWRPRKEET